MSGAAGAEDVPPDTITLARVLEGLRTQLRVINALVLRETKTRYGTHKLGFLWALLEPVASVTFFVVLFSAIRHDRPAGMPLATFMIVGFCCYALFRGPMGQMQGAISSSRTLLAFPQVTTFDVILARGLLELAVGLFVFVLMCCMALLLGYEVRVERPLGVLGACSLLAMAGVGAGFLFASLEPLVPAINQFTSQVLGRPLFFASGIFYAAESLPQAVLDYLLWNPFLHMIELARGAFFHGFETHHGSWLYASAWSVGLLATGLVVHRALRKKAVVLR